LDVSGWDFNIRKYMDSDKPTDPHIGMITQEDLLAYLVGAMQRIEMQLASEAPPPWANRLFLELSKKISSLETEVSKIKSTCAARHGNGHGGQLKLFQE
jgi:hypothetical protein